MPPVRSSAASGDTLKLRRNLYSSPYKRLVAEAFRAHLYIGGRFIRPSRQGFMSIERATAINHTTRLNASPPAVPSSIQVDENNVSNPVTPQLSAAVASGTSKPSFFNHPSSAASAFSGVHPVDSTPPSTPVRRIGRQNVGNVIPFRLQRTLGPDLERIEEDSRGSPMSICNTPASVSTPLEGAFGDIWSRLNLGRPAPTAETASLDRSKQNGAENVQRLPRHLFSSLPTPYLPSTSGNPTTISGWNSHVGQMPFQIDAPTVVIARPRNLPLSNQRSELFQVYYTRYRRQVLYRMLQGLEPPHHQAIEDSPGPSTDEQLLAASPGSVRETPTPEATLPTTPEEIRPSATMDISYSPAVNLKARGEAERRMGPISSINPEGYNLRPRSYIKDGKQVRYGAMMRKM